MCTILVAIVAVSLLEASARIPAGRMVLLAGPVLMGMLVVWGLVLGFVGLLGSMRAATICVLLVAVVLAVVNFARVKVLGAPLMPSDWVYLQRPGFLLSMTDGSTVVIGLVLLTGIGAALILLLGRLRDFATLRPAFTRMQWRALRAALICLGVAAATGCLQFNQSSSVLRASYSVAGASWKPWDQLFNYEANGFVAGVLYNMPAEAMRQPAGYERVSVSRAVERWTEPQECAAAECTPNVVVVLSESYADPRTLSGLEVEESPTPVADRLRAGHPSGSLPGKYGTGTSSMEFQVLTGMSDGLLQPQIASAYQQVLAGREEIPGWPGWFSDRGYRTVALHPYDPAMYRRESVYPAMGFDEFLTDRELDGDRWGPTGFVKDEVPFARAADLVTASSEPVFAHVVTMQNHLPYAPVDDPEKVTGVSAGDAETIGTWVRGLQATDAAIDAMLQELDTLDEPTIVVYFGDHFPGILPQAVLDASGEATTRSPFFLWSNYGVLDGADQLGTVGANALLSIALERAGVGLPPFARLGAEVQQRVGLLSHGSVIRPDGQRIEVANLSGKEAALISDFELVQYDLLQGAGWFTEESWGAPGRVE